MKQYSHHDMYEISNSLTAWVDGASPDEMYTFVVPHPDLKDALFEGTLREVDGRPVRLRSLRCWMDLAESMGCRLLMPQPVNEKWVSLTFRKLPKLSWHDEVPSSPIEKYGIDSPFFALDKREEPAYLSGFLRALDIVDIAKRRRLLDLGVNSGDELALVARRVTDETFAQMNIVGVDHCPSAIEAARRRFPGGNAIFHQIDINQLSTHPLGRFDLVLSIGTLQSPGINAKKTLMFLVQNCLEKNGALMLGFPNCRYRAGEVLFGAKVKNYRMPELSLLIKDIHFAKKYLQQHRFKVTLFGKYYLFLAAVPI